MKFKIKHICIDNFRCFEHLETDLWDETEITASNEAGKTTIASAILWTLTGKDSDGNSNFEIVPAGKYGMVNPSVTLECTIDDRPVTLKREYKAKFTRDKQFSDYAVTTYINDIETGVRKFAEWISKNICDENVFKILSNPKTFVEDCPKEPKELVWQAQRRMLMDIIGGQKTDLELAESDSKWESLVEPLKRYDSLYQYLTYLKKAYSDVQKEFDSFEIRIAQQERNIVPVEHTEEELSALVADIKAKAAELNANNATYRQQQRSGYAKEIKDSILAATNAKDSILSKYNEDKEVCARTKAAYQTKADEIKAECENQMKTLKSYAEALEKLQAATVKDTCDHCGQKLLPAQIESAKRRIAERIQNGEKQTAKIRDNVIRLRKAWEEAQEKVKSIMEPTFPAKAVDDAQAEIEALTAKLMQLPQETDMPGFGEGMKQLESEMDKLKEEFVLIKRNKEVNAEISRIEEEHKENVERMSEAQMLLDIAKEFANYKCKYAEDAINSLFENVRFQLFEKNKSNDDYKEVCNLTFRGHKYADLSASTKIIACLEVVRAFQKFYNVSVPIVIDNAESITGAVDTGAQTVLLSVREECCPECGGHSGRRNADGTWTCQKCGHVWKKKLEIKEG